MLISLMNSRDEDQQHATARRGVPAGIHGPRPRGRQLERVARPVQNALRTLDKNRQDCRAQAG